jgi:hypothetical protein
MATLVKNFKVKSGLVVEGSTGTINGYEILTKKEADQSYIIGLIGGSATPDATADTVVLRDENADFSANMITSDLTGDVIGNLTGDVTGTVSDISNHSTTDLSEGTNLYFTDTRAKDAVAAALGDGIEYEDGSFNVQIATGLVLGGGTGNEIEIDRTEVDTWYDASGAAAAALADAEDYADQAELDAVSTANSYTDGRETAITTAYQSYADTAEADAISAAGTYTDGRETAITTAYQSYADTAEQDAKDYADSLIGDASVDGTSGNTVTDRIAAAVSNLVDSAPETLDTLNELAAALQDNPDVIGDLQDIAAGKQDTLTAGANIDITGATISVTGLDTDDVAEGTNLYFTDARAVTANTGLWDTIGAAATAEQNAKDYADALDSDDVTEGSINLYFTDARALTATASAYDAAGAAATAETNANSYTDGEISTIEGVIEDLTTDGVDEGTTNLYYTTTRAKTDAAALLVGATKTNIEITGDENGLTITAENGVADSTTADLAEDPAATTTSGTMYFTDERAVDALQGTDSMFATVSIDEVALQVAATTGEVSIAGIQTAYAWDKNDYRSAEFLVKVAYGTHTEISKVLLTLDTSDNIAITEYGIVGTNGSASTISAAIVDDEVELQVTTANNNSTITVVGTLLA